jgi:transposase InsO family protein
VACPCRKPNQADSWCRITQCFCPMREACSLIWTALVRLFRTRASLVVEILVLRHQINIQRRHLPKRQTFRIMDRLIFAGLYRLAPNVLHALAILKPETVLKWHRAGFRSYWRWKSRRRAARPIVPLEIRKLIREMSIANPLWGAPRVHGELLKLGIQIGQTSVAKYMAWRRGPPSQGWKTFLRNHADGIAAMDMFVVPTISFRLLYGLLIMGHGRRQILWFGVTAHPTAEWIANQVTEACGWEQVPRYLIRDRDGAYGEIFIRRLRSMGIRDRPTSPRSPWQNGYAERLIGSIRRECLDHIVVLGERHLRHILLSYMNYHNVVRTHLSLEKDAPVSRAVERAGRILCRPILGGLHHQYARF